MGSPAGLFLFLGGYKTELHRKAELVCACCVSCVRVGGLVVKWMGECAGV